MEFGCSFAPTCPRAAARSNTPCITYIGRRRNIGRTKATHLALCLTPRLSWCYRKMVTCAMRCLFAVAMLATNVCAFVAPGRLSPAALRARQERLPAASAVPHRKSRRWIPGKTMKYGREDASATNDQVPKT